MKNSQFPKRNLPKKEVTKTLKDGDAGVVTQTVPKMIELGLRDSKDPFVISVAESKKGKSDIETVENIYEFVWKTFPYEADPKTAEYVTAPVHLLNMDYQYCDCDDMTTLLIALLSALGFELAVKTIAWDKDRCHTNDCPFTHVYLMCFIPQKEINGWIALDAVQKAKGFGQETPPQPIKRQQYFMVN